jgi:hypothetical protein
MTDVLDLSGFPLQAPLVPPDDPIFDFAVSNWIDPPVYVTNLPETTPESDIRSLAEQEYRKSTSPTLWHRYLTLGRYVVDGFTFDTIMEESTTDPLKMHCLIWFQYVYHLDQNIDIPPKLQAWGSTRSQPYLAKHAESAFLLDTKVTTWKEFSRTQSLSNPWSAVISKSKKSKKVTQPKSSITTASAPGHRSKPGTIAEETSKASTSSETRGQKRSANRDDNSAASDGKQSVLIPTLDVPVCDGTYRVTLRWKTSLDMTQTSRKNEELKEEIYKLLNDIFGDDDGFLYNWQHSGTDQRNLISKMTPDEVRQYISPSIAILPSQSMIVIPIRFGFSSNTPSKWRNLESTKEKLNKYDVTASISNCTSISGKLVVAGYILLKAPMTTHRLRYLQSLRKMLPQTTPPFDILLHKRTPLDQQIPHLAVQCGDKHVHSLSEALASILTGDGSALYIPRFVFSRMSDAEANTLFQTHDTHVKSLRWLSLSPLLSNLDRPRKEYQPDGSVIERTTREWARSIKNTEGNALAQCDVVNGGLDQLPYLLFTPQHAEAANIALAEYRKRLYPFTQREAQFRASVGPPPFINLSKSVIANLEFIKRLSATNSNSSVPASNASDSDNSSAITHESGMTDSSVSQITRPITPSESLRRQYSQRTHNSNSSDHSEDASTAASTATAPSKLSDGRMSTSSAKLRELDAVIQRQKKTNDKKDAKNSERISLIERQLHRIDDIDSKLDDVKTDFGQRLNIFETRMVETVQGHIESSNHTMENLNINLEKLMSVVNTLVLHSGNPSLDSLTTTAAATSKCNSLALVAQTHTNDGVLSGSNSHSSSSQSSMSVESTSAIQSPEHKRLRSGKKLTKESVRRHLALEMEAANQSPPTQTTDRHEPPSTQNTDRQESFDSLDLAMQQLEEIAQAGTSSKESTSHSNDQPDPVSQYTASPQTHEEQDNNAIPPPGRGPPSSQ